jgi:uncharacterized membrane protein YkvA (DUF1232 family)
MMFYRLRRLFRLLSRDTVLLWYACRNPATPKAAKLGALLLVMYIVSPIDLIPDTLPVLGWLDDVAVLAFAIPAVLKLVPQPALQQANAATDRLLSRWRLWRGKQ